MHDVLERVGAAPAVLRTPAVEYPVGRFARAVLDAISTPAATPEFLRSWTISHALHVSRAVDHRRLQDAFRKVLARHECLRANFLKRAAGWRMVVPPPGRPDVPIIEVGAVSDGEILALIHARLAEPFDIAADPLFVIELFRCGSRGDVILIRAHHLVTDGWSQIVVSDELVRASFGLPFATARPIGYADYLKRFERAEDETRHEAYWRRAMLPVLEAPNLGRRAKGMRPNYCGAELGPTRSLVRRVDLRGLSEVQALAKSAGATVSNVVGAAFAGALADRGGTDGVYFNTPVALRADADLRGFVGFACDFLPVRCDVRAEPSLARLAGSIGRQMVESLRHTPASATKCCPEFDAHVNDAGGHLRQFECGMLVPEAFDRRGAISPALAMAHGKVMKFGAVELRWIEPEGVRKTSAELDLRTIEHPAGLDLIFAWDTLAFTDDEVGAIADDIANRLATAHAISS